MLANNVERVSTLPWAGSADQSLGHASAPPRPHLSIAIPLRGRPLPQQPAGAQVAPDSAVVAPEEYREYDAGEGEDDNFDNFSPEGEDGGQNDDAAMTGTEVAPLLYAAIQAHDARPNTDEIMLSVGALVHLLAGPAEADPTHGVWALVREAASGTTGYAPMHILVPAAEAIRQVHELPALLPRAAADWDVPATPVSTDSGLARTNERAPKTPSTQPRVVSPVGRGVPSSPIRAAASPISPTSPGARSSRSAAVFSPTSPARSTRHTERQLAEEDDAALFGAKPFLSLNRLSTRLSTHLLARDPHDHVAASAQANAKARAKSKLPPAMVLTLHGLEWLPAAVPPPGLPTGTVRVATRVRVGVAPDGGATVRGNVLDVDARLEKPEKSSLSVAKHAPANWRFTESSDSLFSPGGGKSSDSIKYGPHRLVVRIDEAAANVTARVYLEVVHVFRVPYPTGAKRRYVSAGWTALNLGTPGGTLAPSRKYSLPLRTRSPAHLDAEPLTSTVSGTLISRSKEKQAILSVSLAPIEPKWAAAARRLPAPVPTLKSSHAAEASTAGAITVPFAALPVAAGIRAALVRAAQSLTATAGGALPPTGGPPRLAPADPLLLFATACADDEEQLAAFARAWRNERRKAKRTFLSRGDAPGPDLNKRDPAAEAALKALQRAAAAWMAGVGSCAHEADKRAAAVECMSITRTMAKLSTPAQHALRSGYDPPVAPFSLQQVKVWV